MCFDEHVLTYTFSRMRFNIWNSMYVFLNDAFLRILKVSIFKPTRLMNSFLTYAFLTYMFLTYVFLTYVFLTYAFLTYL